MCGRQDGVYPGCIGSVYTQVVYTGHATQVVYTGHATQGVYIPGYIPGGVHPGLYPRWYMPAMLPRWYMPAMLPRWCTSVVCTQVVYISGVYPGVSFLHVLVRNVGLPRYMQGFHRPATRSGA